ncbi:MAG TPA: hypothetical protein VNA12_06455 [Mycobacteriales bacterium]|nr:hypothetical protein [Mycobacteriales bacterium]
MSWRAAVVIALLLAIGGAPGATAHQRATLALTAPVEGAVVRGTGVDLVLTASGTAALAAVEFGIRLDGAPVDTSGAVGSDSVFTTFSLRTGSDLRLRVSPVRPGHHELRIVHTRDPDDPRGDLVRRFTSTSPPAAGPTATGSRGEATASGEGWGFGWFTLALVGVCCGGVLWLVRRRRGPSAG